MRDHGVEVVTRMFEMEIKQDLESLREHKNKRMQKARSFFSLAFLNIQFQFCMALLPLAGIVHTLGSDNAKEISPTA